MASQRGSSAGAFAAFCVLEFEVADTAKAYCRELISATGKSRMNPDLNLYLYFYLWRLAVLRERRAVVFLKWCENTVTELP